jgi:hypothetical protein
MPRIWNSRCAVSCHWRRWNGSCAPPRGERRLKFWACRLGGTTHRPHFSQRMREMVPRFDPPPWTRVQPAAYWPTETFTEFEVMILVPLVYCAKIVVVPAEAVDCGHIGFSPFATVIMVLSAACQVTLAVTLTGVPPAVAMAVRQFAPVAVALTGSVMELGVTTMLVTLPKVTVAVVVAVAVPEAAVMVLVPAETPVSRPPVVMVATAGVSLDQHTVVPLQLVPPVKVIELPLLSVPAAVNVAVNPWLTVGLGGSIVMLETVGFTKKPVQLMVKASVARKAKAPARRSLFFVDDIVISDRRSRPALILLAPRCA